jgi:hypothetical protein
MSRAGVTHCAAAPHRDHGHPRQLYDRIESRRMAHALQTPTMSAGQGEAPRESSRFILRHRTAACGDGLIPLRRVPPAKREPSGGATAPRVRSTRRPRCGHARAMSAANPSNPNARAHDPPWALRPQTCLPPANGDGRIRAGHRLISVYRAVRFGRVSRARVPGPDASVRPSRASTEGCAAVASEPRSSDECKSRGDQRR